MTATEPDQADPIVEVAGLTFTYPSDLHGEPVLEDVDLRIAGDDFLGIIGPNGGGKTTLLKLLLGLLEPQRGRVRVFGQRPARVRSRVGYVPQQAQIDARVPADALDVVLMGRLSRSSWGPRFGRVHVEAGMEALRQTGTEALARRPISALSGGQRQRILIARALAAEAGLLLLDEPTTGIDHHNERALMELLLRLNERMPIVMVSHDISLVSAHLKRVACVNRHLTCHQPQEVSPTGLASLYHGPVAVVGSGPSPADVPDEGGE